MKNLLLCTTFLLIQTAILPLVSADASAPEADADPAVASADSVSNSVRKTHRDAVLAYCRLMLRYRTASLEVCLPVGADHVGRVLVFLPGANNAADGRYELFQLSTIEGDWVITRIEPVDASVVQLIRRGGDIRAAADTTGSADSAGPEAKSAALPPTEEEMARSLKELTLLLDSRTTGLDAARDLELINRKIKACREFCDQYEKAFPEAEIFPRLRKYLGRQIEMRKTYVSVEPAPEREP